MEVQKTAHDESCTVLILITLAAQTEIGILVENLDILITNFV